MEKKQGGLVIQILVVVTFLAMVVVNALAQNLPINGVTPAQISDSYPNLFAPAGLTFSIWGVIYLLLAAYTLYQSGLFQGKKDLVKTELMQRIGTKFTISSLANIAWIFSWHYNIIPLSMLFMAVILVCLIMINQITSREKFTIKEKFFIRLGFSVYFGWITIATIANATTLLVSLGWNGFGKSETVWTIVILFVGLLIGVATMLKNRDIAYGLVLIWAYFGILIKHTSANGFAGQYPPIITAVIIFLVLFAAAEVYNVLMIRKIKA